MALAYATLGVTGTAGALNAESSKRLPSAWRRPVFEVQTNRKIHSLLKSLIKLGLSKNRFSVVYLKNCITGAKAMSIIVKALSALTLSLCLHFGAFAQFDPADSYMNDIQPIEIDGKFEPMGEGLAGDSI